MTLSLIVAMDKNRLIGKDNALPWHLPSDLKRFKEITMGHSIIMGRKTFESIGKPLPGRKNIVITSQKNLNTKNIEIVHSLKEALEITQDEHETFIIGGARVIKESLPFIQTIYLTEIDHDFGPGDVYLPQIDLFQWFVEKEIQKNKDKDNKYPYTFRVYKKQN